MKKTVGVLVVFLLLLGTLEARYNPRYDKYVSKNDMKNFVKEAVAFTKIYGKKAAWNEFKDKKGLFHRGELYIYAYNFDGVVLSHGMNPGLAGKNLSKLKDTQGVRIIKRMIDEIKKNGRGWLKFYWFHPTTKMITPKLGYFEKVNDEWWIGSGIYLDPNE